MDTNFIKTRAIVSRGSHREGKWAIEEVTLRDLAPNELLVQMVASGICHSDMHFGDAAESIGGYPRVLGHEGKNQKT
jgi:Zn-dependent alcohol dehydrogenase